MWSESWEGFMASLDKDWWHMRQKGCFGSVEFLMNPYCKYPSIYCRHFFFAELAIKNKGASCNKLAYGRKKKIRTNWVRLNYFYSHHKAKGCLFVFYYFLDGVDGNGEFVDSAVGDGGGARAYHDGDDVDSSSRWRLWGGDDVGGEVYGYISRWYQRSGVGDSLVVDVSSNDGASFINVMLVLSLVVLMRVPPLVAGWKEQ